DAGTRRVPAALPSGSGGRAVGGPSEARHLSYRQPQYALCFVNVVEAPSCPTLGVHPTHDIRVLQLEGYEVLAPRRAAEVLSLLADGRERRGTTYVIFDNLQVHDEGQAFLEVMRTKPALRDHLILICTAVQANGDAARLTYGDVLDRYLSMPFTVTTLLA